ncbi:MAG: glycosyltransferase family 39 protein [Hyphomicrobiales bacterium]|nr:glycosyltransferase family 39 protein [Hyphomicrobiales bacterium]
MQVVLARIDQLLKAFLDWISRRPGLSAAFLIAICLAFYLPGSASLPVTDRDEGRFTQATKQMLETGDFIDIRNQDEPRYKKPIGIYWLQAVSVSIFSPDELTQIWAYRIPSLIGVIAAVLLTWWAARPIFGQPTALLAALLLAGAFTLTLEARIAKSDGVLLAFTTLAMGALARIYLFDKKRQDMVAIAALFWIALGLGILIKGPIAPILAALTVTAIIIFDRNRSWLKNMHAAWGIPVMLVITLPWFISIGVVSDWEFYRLALGEDFFEKLHSGKENHWGPPGAYFIVFWWSFWPAALVTTGGAALWLWRRKFTRRTLLLLSWIIPFWIALEVTPTKLPHYSMVVYPAIAMAAAWVLREATMAGQVAMRTYRQAAAIWLFVGALQLIFLLFLHIWFLIAPSFWLLPVLAVIVALSLATVRASWFGYFHAGIGLALVTAFLLYLAAFKLVMPAIDPIWISRQTAEVVNALRPCISSPVVLTRYREPSAVFLLGTDTRILSAEEANKALSAGSADIALLEKKTADKLPLVDPTPRPIACIDGYNVNQGKQLRLQLMTARPESAFTACQVPERYRCR